VPVWLATNFNSLSASTDRPVRLAILAIWSPMELNALAAKQRRKDCRTQTRHLKAHVADGAPESLDLLLGPAQAAHEFAVVGEQLDERTSSPNPSCGRHRIAGIYLGEISSRDSLGGMRLGGHE